MNDQKEISPIDTTDNNESDFNSSEKELSQKKTEKKKSPPKKTSTKSKEKRELIKELSKERDELKDKYLRILAEMDNFKKRVIKEKQDYQKFILSEFLFQLLPVLDNLERALSTENSKNNEESILSGIEMIYKQFLDLLNKSNVQEIESLNKSFDPNFHQALSKEEREDVKEPTVIEVYQKGFLYNNKLLRPSLVKVAIPTESEDSTKNKS